MRYQVSTITGATLGRPSQPARLYLLEITGHTNTLLDKLGKDYDSDTHGWKCTLLSVTVCVV